MRMVADVLLMYIVHWKRPRKIMIINNNSFNFRYFRASLAELTRFRDFAYSGKAFRDVDGTFQSFVFEGVSAFGRWECDLRPHEPE